MDADTRAKVKPKQKIEDAKEVYMTVVFMETCNRGFTVKPMLRDLEKIMHWRLYPSTRVDVLKVLTEYEKQPIYVAINQRQSKK